MKKTLLFVCLAAATVSADAQSLIFDNGPFITDPGLGAGGNDVSAIQPGLSNYGFNNRKPSGFRVAEDITVPVGAIWHIDSLVFFGYQTGSPITSTFTELNFLIWDGMPGSPTAQVVFGDTTQNALTFARFSDVYRTNATDFSNNQRPIMRLIAATTNLQLTAGTYWIDWQTAGSVASGPWVPPVSVVGVPTSGNAQQFGSASVWQPVNDIPSGGTGNNPVSLPFQVYGQSTVNGVSSFVDRANLQVFPNPASGSATISFDAEVLKENGVIQVNLRDALGRLVKTQHNVTGNQATLNCHNLAAGVYVVELSDSNGIAGRTRLVLQ